MNKLAQSVFQQLYDIPEDFVDELLLDETNENKNDFLIDEEDYYVIGRGVLDFNVDDLISEFEK